MENFFAKLEHILKRDKRFVDQEGELLKSEVIDKAHKHDRKLIELLLEDKDITRKFFMEIKNYFVFNTNDFVAFIQDKNFLNDSYTKFKNKIGLTIGGKFLNERKEVALVWPFKDCVLEGGMTKEDEKRKEIFFNEILAQDEIDKLFSPKVLTNWKRYTPSSVIPTSDLSSPRKRGSSSLASNVGLDSRVRGNDKIGRCLKRDENGTIRENLIIKGNNLLALHTLKKQFQGKVKLIYIDPPYNTGNDSFGYNDNFNHSAWLTFMKNRLDAARQLLREDGSIWINIDDSESHYLKVLCDEVFGRENFVANVVWHKKYTTANDATGIPTSHDNILIFQRSESFSRNLLPRGEKQNSLYKNDDHDGKGLWRSDNLLVKTFSPEYVFSIINPNTGKKYLPRDGSCWRAGEETIGRWLKENRIFFGRDGKGAPQLKRYLSEVQQGLVPSTWWEFEEVGHNDESKKELQKLDIAGQNFSTPKPERLLQRIFEIGSNKSDMILDFFAGSGTAGAVAMKMKRQFILVEQMEYIEKVTIERLKKVMGGEQGGISETVGWKGGGDFVYCELMKYNEQFIDEIKKAKDAKTLLKIWNAMKEKSFLHYMVKPEEFDKNISEFKALSFNKQKEILFSVLNKNQLYVNLSEIDDAEFKVAKEDKERNREFYK